MQLRTARLCLDCEEIHDFQACPVCGSETFAYISRWVPAPERRQRPRPAATTSPEAEAYRELLSGTPQKGHTLRLVTGGAVGLAAISLARWMWRGSRAAANESPAGREPTGTD
jgi:hypothetical protein